MIRQANWMVWSAIVVCLAACSGDDKPAGSSSAAVDSCNKVCEKTAEKMCPNPFQISVDDCKQLCAGLVGAASPACQAQLKADSDCQLMQADICTAEDACKKDGGATCM